MISLKNKTLLITGGCGSIGSEIVSQALEMGAGEIRVLDHNEAGHFHLQEKFRSAEILSIVSDIRDRKSVSRASAGCDLIFHTAAMKHVRFCESNPYDAVTTNVVGTQNVIDAALDNEVDSVVAVSTDKAVNPINTMGATKLLSEKLVVNARAYGRKTRFACVRFGNVLDSVGSVIPLFRKQIEHGGPLTLTDPEMTRFFMSIPEAVKTILHAVEDMNGGEVFILKMKALKVKDLADVMIQKSGQEIPIEIIGRRPGEKLHESLFTEEEGRFITEKSGYFILNNSGKENNSRVRPFSSREPDFISRSELEKALSEAGIL